MQIRSHGGGCCGIFHIFGMGGSVHTPPSAADLTQLDNLIASVTPTDRLFEVVLNERQCENWAPALIERGFVLVTHFRNGNTSRACMVFHKCPSLIEDAPRGCPKKPKNRALKSVSRILRENGVDRGRTRN